MDDLTEYAIEQNLIDLLKAQGYQYFQGSDLECEGLGSVVTIHILGNLYYDKKSVLWSGT